MVPAKIRKMCHNKKRLNRLEASQLAAFWGNRAYKCPHCPFWHLTSK